MLKLLCCCLLAASLPCYGQKVITLKPEMVIVTENYHFGNIEILDSRLDTTILGRVVRGALGVDESLAPLKLKDAAIPSFQRFFSECTSHFSSGSQDILVNITDIFLDEDAETGAFGSVDVRAEVYAKKDGRYFLLNIFDKQEVVTAFDATKKLIRELNTSLKNIIEYANNFYSPAVFDKPGLTLEEVKNMRNSERLKKYPQYSVEKPADGIYGTFDEFMQNKPGRPVGMLEKLLETNLQKPKRKREAIYGYAKDGVMYMFEGKKYDTIRIYRRGNELYMQNYGYDFEKQRDQNAMAWFSTIGALAMNTESWYEYILNPRTGNWYQLTKLGERKRKETPPPAEGENNSGDGGAGE